MNLKINLKKLFNVFLLVSLSFLFIHCGTTSQFDNFITAKKDKLMDGDKQLKFISYNIPNLHYIEDYLPFTSQSPWTLPTEFEIRDALTTIKQMGGKVCRMYVLSVRKKGESKNIIRHVLAPGVFNEEAFRALDKVLQIANEVGVRVIIPFVDNWWWWGGPIEYADFRGKKPEDFWTDPQLISDVEKTINFIINRKNTYTGTSYKDDKAILGWETGNEMDGPLTWTNTIATYIKSLDKNHLVILGTHSPLLTQEVLNDTTLDILTTHHYGNPAKTISNILQNEKLTKGKKPYYVGEFGLVDEKSIKEIVDTVISNDITGAMIWSLRSHYRNGGFYEHQENTGAGSYRWPGFESGKMYNEKDIVDFMRTKAFEINNEKVPPIQRPEPPNLLDVKNVYHLYWQGSTGAYTYEIERRNENSDAWKIIADSISDANLAYRPLFEDTSAELGKSYYYRVRAINSGGISEASNEVGPVAVNYKMIIDELSDSTKIFSKNGRLEFLKYQDIYKAKEDNSRLKGTDSAYAIYRSPSEIDSVKLEIFFTGKECPIEVSASDSISNTSFKLLNFKIETFPPYSNYYGMFTPVIYTCNEFPFNSKYLKIVFKNEAQLCRVEIVYDNLESIN